MSTTVFCKHCSPPLQSSNFDSSFKLIKPENREDVLKTKIRFPSFESFDTFNNLIVDIEKAKQNREFLWVTSLLNHLVQRFEDLKNDLSFKVTGIIIKGQIDFDLKPNPLSIDCLFDQKYSERVEQINDNTHYLRIPGKSTAPQILQIDNKPTIQSSHLIYCFNFQEETFVIFVRDYTKPVAVFPGGTSNQSEINDFESVALREFYEETSFIIPENAVIKLVTTMKSVHPFMGVSGIDDEAEFWLCHNNANPFTIDSDYNKNLNLFVKTADPKNLEIDFVFAVPIKQCMIDSSDQVKTTDCVILNTKISRLDRFILWHIFNALYPKNKEFSSESLIQFNFPYKPSLTFY